MDKNLQFHLKVDNDKIVDASPKKLAITQHKGCKVEGDEIVFDGSADAWLQLPELDINFDKGLTIEAWVRFDAFQRYSRLIDFGNGQNKNNIILSNHESSGALYFAVSSGNKQISSVTAEKLPQGELAHVAVTVDKAGKREIYVNGKSASFKPGGSNRLPVNEKRTLNYIGKSHWSQDQNLKGRIFSLRFYNCALSLAEIRAGNPLLAISPLPKFGASYPLAFQLIDDDTKSVLYTLPPEQPQKLTLELINTIRGDIAVASNGAKKATAKSHHFALCFRPGTLDRSKLGGITAPAGWSLAHGTEKDHADCLYLLWTKPEPIPSMGKVKVALKNLIVDSSGGTRSTNVVLRYKNLTMGGSPIEGSRENHLNVLNQNPGGLSHLNRVQADIAKTATSLTAAEKDLEKIKSDLEPLKTGKNLTGLTTQNYVDTKINKTRSDLKKEIGDQLTLINASKQTLSDLKTTVTGLKQLEEATEPPLRVEVVKGWATVLNTTDESYVTLRITPNPALDQYPSKIHSVAITPQARIFLHAEKDLFTIQSVEPEGGNFEPIPAGELKGSFGGIRAKRQVTLKRDTTFPHLDVKVTVRFRPGDGNNSGINARQASFRIHCADVTNPDSKSAPNAYFPDFNVWVPLRIGPLVVDNSGNVGIGTATPSVKFDVEGSLKVSGPASFEKELRFFPDHRHQKAAIGYEDGSRNFFLKVNGSDRLNIDSSGNVGIGTTNPGAKLEVNGNLKVGNTITLDWETRFANKAAIGYKDTRGFYLWANGDRLNIDRSTGNVGIGTRSPVAKLDVSGDLKVSSSGSDFARIHVNSAGAGQLELVGWNEGWNIDSRSKNLYLNRDSSNSSNVHIGRTGNVLFVRGSDGNVGIGTTSPSAKLEIKGSKLDPAIRIKPTISGQHTSIYFDNHGGGAGAHIWSKDGESLNLGGGGVTSLALDKNGVWAKNFWFGKQGEKWYGIAGLVGNIGAANGHYLRGVPIAAAFSDSRLKQSISPIPDALDKVRRLKGVTFQWNEKGEEALTRHLDELMAGPGSTDQQNEEARKKAKSEAYRHLRDSTFTGLIGQDVQTVAPDLVHEGEDGYLRVEYDKVVALLVEAVKDLKGVVDRQQAELSALQAK